MTSKSEGNRRRHIGRLGENLARSLLEELALLPRKDEIDEGEDFWIEVRRSDDRWERVGVQIKASRSFRATRDGAWRIPLRQNAIVRYSESAHPIIVLAVDVTTKAVRWMQLPELVDTAPLTLTVSSGCALTVSDSESFTKALRTLLDRHHATLHSPAKVLTTLASRLGPLDPDITVRLVATESGTELQLGISPALTPVVVSGEPLCDIHSRWADAWKYGRSATLEWKNASLSGSPLLDAVDEAPLLRVEVPANGCECLFTVGWREVCGSLHEAFETRGWQFRGESGVLLQVQSSNLPLGFEGRWPIKPGPMGPSEFSLDLAPWIGEPFARLPYWDGVYDLISALARGCAFFITLHDDGYVSEPIVLGSDEKLCFWARNLLRLLTPLRTLVIAARHTQSSVLLTDESIFSPSPAVADHLALAARLLDGEVIALPAVDWPVEDKAEIPDRFEVPAELALTCGAKCVATLEVEYLLVHYTSAPAEHGEGRRLAPTPHAETYMRLFQRSNGLAS